MANRKNRNAQRVFIGIGIDVPKLGERYFCYIVDVAEKPIFTDRITGLVEEVMYIGSNIYKIATKRSMYILRIVND